MKKRQVILILGMHRSGTSLLAHLVSQVGYELGQNILPAGFDNPSGFYENQSIVDFNDSLLSKLGLSWQNPSKVSSQNFDELWNKECVDELDSLMQREFGNSSKILIKDPRMCRLLPIWIRYFQSKQYHLKFLFSLRDPKEIALSLHQRNNFSYVKSSLLFMRYVMDAVKQLSQKKVLLVFYDQLLNKSSKTINDVISFLEIDSSAYKVDEIMGRALIKPELHHHQSKDTDELKDNASIIWGRRLFQRLKDLPKHKLSEFVSTEFDNPEFEALFSGFKSDKGQDNFGKIFFLNDLDQIIEQQKFIHDGQKLEISVVVNPKHKGIQRIVMVPIHKSTDLLINTLECFHVDEQVPFVIKTNADQSRGMTFAFNHMLPKLIINFEEPVILTLVKIDMDFKDEGSKIDQGAKPQSKSQSIALWEILKLVIARPVHFLKQFNFQNFRILRSALKRESPKEIFKNYRKLLNEKEFQPISHIELEKNKRAFLSLTKIKTDSDTKLVSDHRPKEKGLTIVYVNVQLPEYDTSSGGHRATELIKLLCADHDVHLFSIHSIKERYAKHLSGIGAQVIRTRDFNKIQMQVGSCDVLLYTRYFTYYEAPRFKEIFPSAHLIIDSEDVNWVREFRSIGIWEGITEKIAFRNKKRELQAFDLADQVWVVSEDDKAHVLKERPHMNIAVISNIHELNVKAYKQPDRNVILFFGGFSHYPNISSATVLANDIFPVIKNKISDAELVIAGSNAPKDIIRLNDIEGVRVIGFVEDDMIPELYANSKLTIVPILAGAGVKGKITQAMAFRLPIITNTLGNEGINLIHNQSGFITDDLEEMSAIAIDILSDKFDLEQITRNAQKVFSEKFSQESVGNKLNKTLYRKVNICIVTWNGLDFLKTCLESIFEHTVYPNYHIIIHSNACIDGTQEYLKNNYSDHDQVTLVLSKTNDVFVKPNNTMMMLDPSADVVLLNNDVVVTQGWLKELHDAAYHDHTIGVVGSKLLFPDGKLQEFGAEIYEDGSGRNIGKHSEEPFAKKYSRITAVGYVSGCSIYIKRSTINVIGLLDEIYHPLYFEDSDYCYRCWQSDLTVAVVPNSVVYHYEGGTSGQDENLGMKKYQVMNRTKFLNKHQHHLKSIGKRIKSVNRDFSKRYNHVS